MTNIKGIIANHRAKLEAAGLLRRVEFAKLPPKVASMRPSLTKVRLALQERSTKLTVQPSPMSILFEYTIPKIEHVLVELGEERAEQLISRLCEHGRKIIEEHGIDGSREYLEELLKDLPKYEVKLRAENGLDEIIEAYRLFHFGNKDDDYLIFKHGIAEYLKIKLGDKIEKFKIDDNGLISLKMIFSTNNSDLIYLRRIANLKELDLKHTQVSDLTPLSGLTSLRELSLGGSQVSDIRPLSGLTKLIKLGLWETQVSDIRPLSGLTKLMKLSLWETRVSDLKPLSGLTSLQVLYIWETRVSDLTPLSGLTKLIKLSLGETQVSDITPLSGLTRLQELDLGDTDVSDITPLSSLTRLQRVDLKGTQVSKAQVDELRKAIPRLEIAK